jgi:phospholipid/cholesterol/gamma-HCH transport system ATP-binding protein
LLTHDPYVSIENLSFSRGNRKIFDDINLVIPKGKVTAVMGPSGTGKTTLLKLIGAALFPETGRIMIDGHDIHKLNRQQLLEQRKDIGLLFQTGALFTDLTVYENVAFPLREHTDLVESMIHDLVLMKLEAVGLRGAHNLMPSELSGGMTRRVALARTIIMDPKLILYDEPFTGQDPISMGMLVSLIKELNQVMTLTSVIVSHDVAETLGIADYVYILSGGKVVGQGSPYELKNSTDPYVVQFLEGKADGVVPFHYPCKPFEEDLLENV